MYTTMKKTIEQHKADLEKYANMGMFGVNSVEGDTLVLLSNAIASFEEEVVKPSAEYLSLYENFKKNNLGEKDFNKSKIALIQSKMIENNIIYS